MSQVDRLAAKLAKMERDIADLQRAPQLQNSSLEGTIPITNPRNGKPVGAIGQLPDGSWGVGVYTGPVPPPPTPPTLKPVPGGLAVTWDGRFVSPDDGTEVACPMDFTRVEVHLYETSGGYDPIYSPFATIESPRGGTVNVVPLPAGRVMYCVLVTRNTAGGASIPSGEASAAAASFVSDAEIAQIATDLDANKTALEQANLDIQQAFTDAANAQAVADLATGKADAAQQDAGAAMTAANGKNKVFYGANPPTASAVNDVWFETDADNKPYRWDGTTWVAEPLGNAAIGNLDAAKITTGYLAAARIAVGSLSGDVIVGNTIHGDKIIGNTITGGKIMANEIVGAHIRGREIGADKIVGGSITAYEIASTQIQARHITSDAITGKVITAGMFRTDYSGNDRVEMINEVQYDNYLGQWRNLRDTIRWIRGGDNVLVGEIRGYMGDIQAHGLHLNSTMELGNVQSVIWQVGKRAARGTGGNMYNVRVRADKRRVTVDASGYAWVPFSYPMPQTPTFVVATLGNTSAGGDAWCYLYSSGTDGFTIGVHDRLGAFLPNIAVDVNYYAEIVV